MEYDGGGWTLIYSGEEGNITRSEGEVLSGSSAYMPRDAMMSIAENSTQVHIRTRNTDLTTGEYLTSTHNSLPIQNLRNGSMIYTSSSQDSASHWNGTMISTIWVSCTPYDPIYPSIFHACGNGGGIHAYESHYYTWTLDQSRGNSLNEPMEFYVR